MAQINPLSALAAGSVTFPPVRQAPLIPTPPPEAPTPQALSRLEVLGAQPELENLFAGAVIEQDTPGLMGPAQSLYPAPIVPQPIFIREPAAASGASSPGGTAATLPGAGGAGANSLAALETAREIITLSELGPPTLAGFQIAADAYLMEIEAQQEMSATQGPAIQREWFG